MAKRQLTTKRATPAKKTSKPALTDNEAAQLFEDYSERPALMTRRRLMDYEKAIRHSNQTDNYGTARRAALAVLTKPWKHLVKAIKKDRDVALGFAEAEDVVAAYSKILTELAEHVAEGHRRLMMALCVREDMGELLAEVNRTKEAAGAMPNPDAIRQAITQKRLNEAEVFHG